MTMEQQALSLYELNGLVKRSIRSCLPDTYWVQAELSDVRTNYSGHCYLEFVQKDAGGNNLIAKARGTIWSNIFKMLKPYFEQETGQAFTSGIKVLVEVSVEFHELYGFSLTVLDIDPTYTVGDMERKRREILRQLEEEGVIDLNKELEMPMLPQRVAVISSATAAGYGDFCNQLTNNPRGYGFRTELFPAIMQGERVEESVIAALDAIYERMEEFDVVVIIRGGGATSDLSGFDTYALAANCAQFPLPIITGIGHERDDTVIDKVAHTRVQTLLQELDGVQGNCDQQSQKGGDGNSQHTQKHGVCQALGKGAEADDLHEVLKTDFKSRAADDGKAVVAFQHSHADRIEDGPYSEDQQQNDGRGQIQPGLPLLFAIYHITSPRSGCAPQFPC